jgi:hypothetical protein
VLCERTDRHNIETICERHSAEGDRHGHRRRHLPHGPRPRAPRLETCGRPSLTEGANDGCEVQAPATSVARWRKCCCSAGIARCACGQRARSSKAHRCSLPTLRCQHLPPRFSVMSSKPVYMHGLAQSRPTGCMANGIPRPTPARCLRKSQRTTSTGRRIKAASHTHRPAHGRFSRARTFCASGFLLPFPSDTVRSPTRDL